MENKIKFQIKNVAKSFDLKFKPEWFRFKWIPIKYHILTEYIGDCPDPIYEKYGKTKVQRIKNIEKFISSKDFKKCLKRFGGQVLEKKGIKEDKKLINQITNKSLKKDLLNFNSKLGKEFDEEKKLALLSITNNKKQKEWQLKNCLKHEWIHILLENNEILFQKINKKHWKYDEGLVTYMEVFIDQKTDKLEKMRDKEDYPMEKQYYIYGIIFREILKDKKTPKERKQEIIKLMEKLKYQNGK